MKKNGAILVIPSFDFTILNSVEGQRTRSAGYYLYYPPLGLCSIAATLRAGGFGVSIFDGQFERGWPGCLLRKVEEESPALVGILTTTPALPVVKHLVSELRALRERTGAAFKIAAGGPHISCDPDIAPELGADFGVIGDGEEPTLALMEILSTESTDYKNAPGLLWTENGNLRRNPPSPPGAMMNYPIPARELLNRDKYYNPFFPAPTTSALAARGCPFECSFCCRSHAMGVYRARPVDAFLEEIRRVQEQGYGFVSIVDETFTYDSARAAAIAEGLLALGPKFKWSCQTRADTADAKTLALLRRAGCINMSFGVEAGDPAVRGRAQKSISDNVFQRAFSLCREAGISTNAFIMIGNPGEGEAEIERSLEFARKLDPDYAAFNIGTLFPGSRFYEQLLNDNKIDRSVWTKYMNGEIDLPLLSDRLDKAALSALLRRGFMEFYLRPAYIMKRLAAMRSPRQIWHLARRAGTIVGDYVFSKN